MDVNLRLRGPWRGGVGLLVAAAAVAGVVWLNRPTPLPQASASINPTGASSHALPPSAERAGPLTVDAKAFHGFGRLAFVSRHDLYILDGSTSALHRVAQLGESADLFPPTPAWSPDGRWLAFAQPGTPDRPGNQLWIVSADGQGARPLPVGEVAGFAWSPTDDVLAVIPDASSGSGGLWLVSPDGAKRELLPATATVSLPLWSPDGKTLAYTVGTPRRIDRLYTISAAGGVSREIPVRWPADAAEAGLILAGWWPDGRGLLFWVDPSHSQSLAADGLMLYALPLAGGDPRPLTITLVNRFWLSWLGQDGTLVAVVGGDRRVWMGKSLALCRVPKGQCETVPSPPGTVALDPSASPDGRQVAFVHAVSRGEAGGWVSCSTTSACNDRASQEAQARQALLSWMRARTLWLLDPQTGATRQVLAAGSGVYGPVWSRDGKALLFVKENGIWLLDLAAGQARRIVYPLVDDWAPFGFYGQWSALPFLAWYR